MSPATNPPPAPAAPAKPAAAGTAHATAPAKAPAAPAAAQPAAGATAVAPATQDKKSGGKMADMFKKVGSSVGGKTKGMPKKVQMIFAVVILLVVVIVIGAVAMRGGSTAPKKPSTINIEDLQDWNEDISKTQNLAETQSVTFNIADLLGGGTNGTYFIKEVTVTLTWRDEDDVRRLGRMRTNQPDEFEFVINTTINATAEGPATMNDVNSKAGSIGPITMKVSDSGYDYVIVGNSTSLRLPETVTTSDVTVTVHLINAGDFHASGPEALYWNDLGNDFTVKITVSGKMYTPEAKTPAKK